MGFQIKKSGNRFNLELKTPLINKLISKAVGGTGENIVVSSHKSFKLAQRAKINLKKQL